MLSSFSHFPAVEMLAHSVLVKRADGIKDVFDYIEMFYNPERKYVGNGMLSPVEFGRQQENRYEGT